MGPALTRRGRWWSAVPRRRPTSGMDRGRGGRRISRSRSTASWRRRWRTCVPSEPPGLPPAATTRAARRRPLVLLRQLLELGHQPPRDLLVAVVVEVRQVGETRRLALELVGVDALGRDELLQVEDLYRALLGQVAPDRVERVALGLAADERL